MGWTNQKYKAREKNRWSVIKIISKEAGTLKGVVKQFEGC